MHCRLFTKRLIERKIVKKLLRNLIKIAGVHKSNKIKF